jgi:hypothetical protein
MLATTTTTTTTANLSTSASTSTSASCCEEARWQHFHNCKNTVASVRYYGKSFFVFICIHCSGSASLGKLPKRLMLSPNSYHHLIDIMGLDLSSLVQSMNTALSCRSKESRNMEMDSIASQMNVMINDAVHKDPENAGRRIFEEISSSSRSVTVNSFVVFCCILLSFVVFCCIKSSCVILSIHAGGHQDNWCSM